MIKKLDIAEKIKESKINKQPKFYKLILLND